MNNRRTLLRNSLAMGGLLGLGACATAAAPTPPRPRAGIDGIGPLAPMRAHPDRIFDIKCCIRPFRPQGPRLDAEQMGDTLVIHTISLKPGEWNRSHPEYSDKTETVELVKKNADGRIETRMTVYDPESLQKPWHVIWGSQRVTTPNLRINMWACTENNNVVKTAEGVTQFVLPGEAGYKDPSNFAAAPPADAK